MCTVTFLPLPGGGYLLGSNRDERADRPPARPPEAWDAGAARALAPVDAAAGGTWLAADDRGRSLCVLNGDRGLVESRDDAPSRGLLVRALMEDPTPDGVWRRLEARAAEGALRENPFKLLVAAPGEDGAPAAAEVVEWDGRELARRPCPAPGVVVSNGFDAEGVAERRRAAFAELAERAAELAAPGATADEGAEALADTLAEVQLRWHASHRGAETADGARHGDTSSVCMHREEVSSVSFTRVRVGADTVAMDHVAGQPCRAGPAVTATLPRVASAPDEDLHAP